MVIKEPDGEMVEAKMDADFFYFIFLNDGRGFDGDKVDVMFGSVLERWKIE